MAVKMKRSALQGKVPTTTQLELGELAVNTYDGRLFLKKDDGTEAVIEVGANSGAVVSATPPLAAAPGTMWYSTDEKVTFTRTETGHWFALNGYYARVMTLDDVFYPELDDTYSYLNDTFIRVGKQAWRLLDGKLYYAGFLQEQWRGEYARTDPAGDLFYDTTAMTITAISASTSVSTSATKDGVYTPPAGCTNFFVMLWGNGGSGGNNVAYGNLPRTTCNGTGGRGYTERHIVYEGGSYNYSIGPTGRYGATSSGPRTVQSGPVSFTGNGVNMNVTPNYNYSRTPGAGSGGTFNATGGYGGYGVGGQGGGSGSRKGNGLSTGYLGGTDDAPGTWPIKLPSAFKGINWTPGKDGVDRISTYSARGLSGAWSYGGSYSTTIEYDLIKFLDAIDNYGSAEGGVYSGYATGGMLIFEYYD